MDVGKMGDNVEEISAKHSDSVKGTVVGFRLSVGADIKQEQTVEKESYSHSRA